MGAMKEFISKYEDRIHGVLSCFDRMLFRVLLLHGSRLRLNSREATDLVSSSDTGIREWTRVAGAQAEGEWNRVYEMGERIPLDRGHGASPGLLRPFCFTGVAPDTESVCPESESAHGKTCSNRCPTTGVTAQSEDSTDILFKSALHLSELYPRLLSHSTLCFGAKEVMSFLGKKIRSQFEGEVVTDVCDLSFKRIAGSRMKHRVKQNWLKMYDKAGSVLRD
jgi:hypothetical protein